MPFNVASFSAADHIVCEAYASKLIDCVNGRGPYPGLPPPGYREVFKRKQPYAPLPEEFLAAIGASGNHAGQPKPAQTTAPEVVLSTGALATLMKEQHKLLQTVMHTALAETHRYAPRVYRDQGYHRGPGASSFRHRFDRGNQRRGGHSLAERVNTKPRGKRAGVAHRRNRKNNDEVMVPEAVPGVSDSVDTQPRVETPTEPVHNESVKLEDGEVNMGSNDEIDSLFNDFGLDSEDSGMNMANCM
ncbi:hypothetical protein GGX14DRAFT_569171 [Mycena pura]|uniref:Uncharacterized protein n=1 Tax=Mycena pura TaxID=153505 RepID=A0AAD6V8C3_9AGAR|nr:hypothetical protein GGX14DRAFT_569171 [Mycena pura]